MTAPSMLRLRSYQSEALDSIDKALTEHTRVAAVVPTGGGKTVIFAHLIERANRAGTRALVLVHREELAEQAKAKIHSAAPHLSVGIVKAERNEIDADVIVASVQTLAVPHRREQIEGIGIVIVDECFPAGTLVGGRPIETIKVGDLVPSWHEETGREVLRPVTRVMAKAPESMVRVTLENGEQIDCTTNHPFLTTQGWMPAGMLRGELVVSFTHHAYSTASSLHTVLSLGSPDGEGQDRLLASIGSRVLQPGASGRVGAAGSLGADVADEPRARLGSDEGSEPDARPGGAGEDVRHVAADPSPAPVAWWQRRARARAAAAAGRFPGVADGSGNRTGRRRTPLPLQGGLRASVDAGLRRGGWGIPFRAGPPALRPETGRAAVCRRVVDVQVLERGSDGTYGGVCRDGLVYNLEVEGTHTYLIEDGVVVHNCHHAVARTWMEVLAHFGCFATPSAYSEWTPEATPAVGFTATLDRSDGKGLGDVWETVAFERDILYMIDNGYLTDVRGTAVTVDGLDLATVAKSRGDYQEGQLGEAMMASGAAEVVARAYLQHASMPEPHEETAACGTSCVKQGVLFAPTVASAYDFAQGLEEVGIKTECITGTMDKETRAGIYARYEAGETRVLSNVMVLTEGWDAPWCEVAVIARPTQSAALYTQMVGRVLRPWRNKGTALVLDVVGVAGQHKLQSLTNLVKTEVHDGESYAEARVRIEKEKRKAAGLKGGLSGVLASLQVELFANSHSTWLQTKGGKWFIPVTHGVFFLWPALTGEGDQPGTWRLGYKVAKRGGERGGGWIESNLTLEYAMAWGETMSELDDPTVSLKDRAWRRTKPSQAQIDLALRMKIAPPEHVLELRKGALSDLISTHMASKMLDI